jgi:carbon storage regulator
MLVLTRKTNESVVIAGGIEVMVVQVRGNRVRLGFRAPADISIQRCERVADHAERLDGVRSAADAPGPVATIATRPDRTRTAARPR